MDLILLLILFFILWPLLRGIWRAFTQFRTMRRFMNDPGEYFRQQAAAGARQQNAQNPRPKRCKKKIDRDQGEYVEFTEVEISEEERRQRQNHTVDYSVESQVTDIKWKDL